MENYDAPEITVKEAKPLTPHNKAMYEAGKALLIDSITVSRDFSKFMITICTGAIPIHLGLLKFFLPENHKLTLTQGAYASIPCFIFLTAAIIFMTGFYPQTSNLSLDLVESIENEREKTLTLRRKRTIWATLFFVVGTITMIICEILFMTTIDLLPKK